MFWKKKKAEETLTVSDLMEYGREEAARLIAIEKAQYAMQQEQERQRKEQERLLREQEKQEREQRRQAEQLAKHEREIKDLQFRVKACEMTYAAQRQRIENLEDLYEMVNKELEDATMVGDDRRRERALRKIIALDSQLATAEAKKHKASHDWTMAKEKLAQ